MIDQLLRVGLDVDASQEEVVALMNAVAGGTCTVEELHLWIAEHLVGA